MKEQHVQIPTKEDKVTPNELLVYSAIKRYDSNDRHYAYPSVATISKHTGLGKMAITKAVERLKDLGYFSKIEKRPNNSSIYYFSEYKKFEIFSFDFLDMDAPNYVKAYILATQKLMHKQEGTHEGIISYSDLEESKRINMNRKMIAKANKWLENHNMMSKLPTKVRDTETGLFKQAKFYNLDKLQQAIIFQTIKNTEDIETLKQENQYMKKEMELMKEEIKRLQKYRNAEDAIFV